MELRLLNILFVVSVLISCTSPSRILPPSNMKHNQFAIKSSYSKTSHVFDLEIFKEDDPFQYWYLPEFSFYYKFQNLFFSAGMPPHGPFGLGYTFTNDSTYQWNLISQASLTTFPGCMVDCRDMGLLSIGSDIRMKLSEYFWIGTGIFFDKKIMEHRSTLSRSVNDGNRSLNGNRKTDSITTLEKNDHYIQIKINELATPIYYEVNFSKWSIISAIEVNFPIYNKNLVKYYTIEGDSINQRNYESSNKDLYLDWYINISRSF